MSPEVGNEYCSHCPCMHIIIITLYYSYMCMYMCIYVYIVYINI